MTKNAATGPLSRTGGDTGGVTEGDTRAERLAAGGAEAAGRRVRPAFRLLVAAWLRRRFWRTVLFLTGGLTVKGKLP
ncbi:hypothetical protein ACI2L5_57190, partial [Streptomyces milbemycinicus]